VWRVAISPDGDLAASAGEDGYVHVWKLNEGGPDIRPWKSFGRFDDGVMGVTFTRQDRIVFTSGASNVQPPLTVRALTL
jgi:WD40 repeat protein